jgi:hypothetical protein
MLRETLQSYFKQKDFNAKFHSIVLLSKELQKSNWMGQKHIYKMIQIYAVGSSTWYVWLFQRHERTLDLHPNPPAEIEFLFPPLQQPRLFPTLEPYPSPRVSSACPEMRPSAFSSCNKNRTNLFQAAFR